MLISSHFLRRRWLKRIPLRRILLVLAILSLLDAFYTISQLPFDPNLAPSSNTERRTTPRKVFIASIHQDSAPRLHASWATAILDLTERLGKGNVFFSAVEFASSDGTKTELSQLEDKLEGHGVPHRVVLGMTEHDLLDIAGYQPEPGERWPGWVFIKETKRYALRRRPIVVEARNHALAPLKELARAGRMFDTVLWIEDNVVFSTDLVLDLLNTRDGEYSATCAVDFTVHAHLGDLSSTRDDLGHAPASLHWPWFHSSTSASAARALENIPVQSCWNGLVAMDSTPFYADPPLKFRHIDDRLADLHIEASETCLLHADNQDSGSDEGIWLNPNVRIGHSKAAYTQAQQVPFPGWKVAVIESWGNRLDRWRGTAHLASLEQTVRSSLRQWVGRGPKGDLERHESAVHCLMDDMQIVKPREIPWHMQMTLKEHTKDEYMNMMKTYGQ